LILNDGIFQLSVLTVDLKQVNAVLMQPHWRHNTRDETQQPVVFTNQKPKG
jgi:hypothetical protein